MLIPGKEEKKSLRGYGVVESVSEYPGEEKNRHRAGMRADEISGIPGGEIPTKDLEKGATILVILPDFHLIFCIIFCIDFYRKLLTKSQSILYNMELVSIVL